MILPMILLVRVVARARERTARPARCGGPWARLGAWAPSLVCGGFARRSLFWLGLRASRRDWISSTKTQSHRLDLASVWSARDLSTLARATNTRRTASKRPIVPQRLTNAQSQARSTVVYHHYDDCLANWDAHDPSTCSRRGAGCRSASSHCSRARASKDADRRGDGGASGSQGGTFEAAIAQGTNGCQGTFRCGLPNGKAGGCQGSFVVICWSGRLPSARRCWWLELGQSIHRFVSRQAHRRPIKALPHAE
jgi:hypothetical protein